MTLIPKEFIITLYRREGTCYNPVDFGVSCPSCPFSLEGPYCSNDRVFKQVKEYILSHPEDFLEVLL